jgi:anti-sigma B factor antagonist
MQENSIENRSPLKLSGSLNIQTAEPLKSTLVEYVKTHSPVLIDVSEVQSFDAIGIQLLCSARKTAEDAKKAFRIEGTTPAFTKALEEIGLRPETSGRY